MYTTRIEQLKSTGWPKKPHTMPNIDRLQRYGQEYSRNFTVVTKIKQRSYNRPLIPQPADPLTHYSWHWAGSFRFEINTLKLTVVNFQRLSIKMSKSKVPLLFAMSLNIRETSFLEESTSCPGNVVPGNVVPGNVLSGKRPFTILETNCVNN